MNYKTLLDIVKQLEICEYKCTGGNLENNTAFIKLKELASKISAPLVVLQKQKSFTPEFDVDDQAWYMKNNKPVKVVISAIEIFYVNTDQDYIKYNATDMNNPVTWLDHRNLFEKVLFRTKKELLEAL